MQKRAQQYVTQAQDFLREYTQGLRGQDLRRLFDQDAAHAYKVLTRDRDGEQEPAEPARRFFYRIRVVFLGLSYKLSPARRILFVLCLACALLGLLSPLSLDFSTAGTRVEVDFSPLWFLAAIAGLLWLLIMELVDRVRVRDELEVARKLQSELLPEHSPVVAGWEFAHSYRTANEVGGDYYDFIHLADGRIALLMGDASGHGIAAGLLMAIANATLKTAVDTDPTPLSVAAQLNRTLCRTGDRRAFMTLFYGLLEPDTGRLDFICAGHPFPLLRRAGGEINELGSGTLPLGMKLDVNVPQSTVTLGSGDLLVLFTDGLPEAVDSPQGSAFGFQRLRSLLAEVGSAAAVHDRVLLAFDQHVGHEPLNDDLTLVVVAHGSARPPSRE